MLSYHFLNGGHRFRFSPHVGWPYERVQTRASDDTAVSSSSASNEDVALSVSVFQAAEELFASLVWFLNPTVP